MQNSVVISTPKVIYKINIFAQKAINNLGLTKIIFSHRTTDIQNVIMYLKRAH